MADIIQPSNDWQATLIAVAASIAAAHRSSDRGTPQNAKEEAKLVRELYLHLRGKDSDK